MFAMGLLCWSAFAYDIENDKDFMTWMWLFVSFFCFVNSYVRYKHDIKSKNAEVEHSCKTCEFNDGMYCTAGSYYAKRKMNKLCVNGELWKDSISKWDMIPDKCEYNGKIYRILSIDLQGGCFILHDTNAKLGEVQVLDDVDMEECNVIDY